MLASLSSNGLNEPLTMHAAIALKLAVATSEDLRRSLKELRAHIVN
jgi:hypothetical protein